MRTTLIVKLTDPGTEFLYRQPGTTDPSMLINHLLREEKKREGLQQEITGDTPSYHDPVKVAMENFLDEDIRAAD